VSPEGEPPRRDSHLSLDNIPVGFPDDGNVSRLVRKVDNYLGLIEQGFLFALLAAVVIVASVAAIWDKLHQHHVLDQPLGRWWFTVVRGGTFCVALFGAAYTTHQQRHLAMDLVSRRISPRARLVLGVVLKVVTILIAGLLLHSGLHQRAGGAVDSFISDETIVKAIPVGAALIMLHCALHIVIDVEYLFRGKLPPEKARTGH